MRKALPRWLGDHFWVKTGMLLLAILLWFLVVTEKVFEDTFDIPVTITGVPVGKTPTMGLPDSALVRFHGRAKELIRIHYVDPPHLNIDFSTISDGRVIKPKPEMVIIPGGLNISVVEIIKPDSLIMFVDDFQRTKLPVNLNYDIGFEPGYTLFDNPKIVPDSVIVSGPERIVSSMRFVQSDSIKMQDLNRTTKLTIKLVFPENRGIKCEPEAVDATFRVERLGVRDITGITVAIENSPKTGSVYLEPTQVKAEFRGSISSLARIEAKSINAWINCNEFDPGHPGWLPVHVEAPPGTELTAVTPAKLRVTVRK